MEIREVEKLCHSNEGLLDAYRRGLMLQEKGWVLYPAASWDSPAILAFDDDKCVAGVNWSINDSRRACVDFAWCSPESPKALMACLLRFRSKLRELKPEEVSFTCHVGNAPMEKLVAKMALRPHSQTYRVPTAYYAKRDEPPKPNSRFRQMLLNALQSLERKVAQ
jgi:predicted DNA-binding transcriptional regulator